MCAATWPFFTCSCMWPWPGACICTWPKCPGGPVPGCRPMPGWGPGDGAVDTGTGARSGLKGPAIKWPGGPPGGGGGGQKGTVLTSGADGTA